MRMASARGSGRLQALRWVGHHITGRVLLNESIGGQCVSQESMGAQAYVSYQMVSPVWLPAPPQPDQCAE